MSTERPVTTIRERRRRGRRRRGDAADRRSRASTRCCSALFVVSAIGVPVLRAAAARRAWSDTWDRLDDGDPWWLAVALVLRGPVVRPATCSLFQGGLRARRTRAIDLPRELPDHDGRAGGDAAVRRRRRRRHRADRLGAARARACRAARSPTRMIAFLVLLYGVYMAALVVAGFGLYAGRLPRRRRRSRSPSSRRSSARSRS